MTDEAPTTAATTIAVIGHVEWVELLGIDHVPVAGELLHARREPPRAGGSAVIAASVIAQQGAAVRFIGAVGNDAAGTDALAELRERGVAVDVARRPGPTRRAFVFVDAVGERTIVTAGERWAATVADDLGWETLEATDGVYLTAGDEAVFRSARRARTLVATPRAAAAGRPGSVPLDALVFSANDPEELELAERLREHARLLVGTEGADGGRWWGESEGTWKAVDPLNPVHDSYGSGDAFAAGFTLGLARGYGVAQCAALGARCGALMLTRVGAP